MNALPNWLKELITDISTISFNLFKLMVPILIGVKIIEELGGIDIIASLLAPVMELVGLPPSMGLVWATTLVTNIYGGMLIFISTAGQESLSVAQVTVLGSMMLVAHALPLESRIIQKAGVRLIYVSLLRVFGALLLGFILHTIYSAGNYLSQPNQALWNPTLQTDDSLLAWLSNQTLAFAQIFVIITVLVCLLKIIKLSGIEKLIAAALQPLLRLIGLDKNTTSITIIGVLLGVLYGGGLLINEAKSGELSQQNIFGSMTLLALLHSLIEDTVLIMLLGAHISGVFYARVVFALLLSALLIRFIKQLSEVAFHRYFVIQAK